MSRIHFLVSGTLAGMLVAGTAVTMSGQSPQALQPGSDMAALVNEIHLLRADLTRGSGLNSRMQLLTARLSLAEQRLSTVWRQMNELEPALNTAMNRRVELDGTVRRLEEALPNISPEQRKDFEGNLGSLKNELTGAQTREQQLRNQMNEISSQMNTEQSRWSEFNSRLDELERSLNDLGR